MSWPGRHPRTMRVAAHILQDLGFMLYAGPLIALSMLIMLAPRIQGLSLHGVVRTYRAWGPGLGLALGACILGTLTGEWLDRGEFSWSLHSATEQWRSATHGLFVVAWVSNIKLEIWTLEPLRKLDSVAPADPPDASAYAAAAQRLGTHMAVHSALILGVTVLEIIRRAL